mgnify:CR=1 FL=1
MPNPYRKFLTALGVEEGNALDRELREEALDEMAGDFLTDLKVKAGVSEEDPEDKQV